ncbi:MAG TPA: phosphodiesterase [Methylococcaceae bacterium]|nr:phosphodiesterase [Methylococcaceae bacterium]
MSALRILHLTDTHILAEPGQTLYGVDTYGRTAALLDHVRRTAGAPDLAVLSGDCVDTPSAAAYGCLKALLAEHLAAPCLILPGNHDDPMLLKAMFPDAAVPQAIRDNWLFVLLDSTRPDSPSGMLSDAELARLEATLAEHPAQHALIALHHHPLPVGSPWMDAMGLAEDSAARLLEILRRSGNVRLVLCGHAHQEHAWTRHGVPLFVTPSSTVQFQPGCDAFTLDRLPPGCRWLELCPDGGFSSRLIWLPE